MISVGSTKVGVMERTERGEGARRSGGGIGWLVGLSRERAFELLFVYVVGDGAEGGGCMSKAGDKVSWSFL